MITPEKAEKLKRFVDGVMAGKSIMAAGTAAGFPNPYRDALPFAMQADTRRYCRNIMRGRIDFEAAPEAYSILLSLMRDTTATKALRAGIAQFLLSHSLPAPKAQELPDDGAMAKTAREMTNDELHAILAQSESELANRATMLPAPQSFDDFI